MAGAIQFDCVWNLTFQRGDLAAAVVAADPHAFVRLVVGFEGYHAMAALPAVVVD